MTASELRIFDIAKLEIIRNKGSKIYDPREADALDDAVTATYRGGNKFVPPIIVITRENAERITGETFTGEHVVWMGRQRTKYTEAAGGTHIEGKVVECGSVDEFNLRGVEENTHRRQMTLEEQIDRCRRFYESGITDIDRLCAAFVAKESTVRTWLRLAEVTGGPIAPEVKEAIKNGELSATTAGVITSNTTVEEQKAIMQEVAPAQVAALMNPEANKKGDAVNVTTNQKGETVAAPTHAAVTDAKNKVKNRPATPKSESKPKVTGAAIDRAIVRAKLDNVKVMRRLPGADAGALWLYEATLANLLGEAIPAVPDNVANRVFFETLAKTFAPAAPAAPATETAAA